MRRRRGNSTLLWAAGALLTAVVALTAYSALTGDDEPEAARPPAAAPTPTASVSVSPKPLQSYTVPATWTEPARWSALPRGSSRAANGRPTGFPATADGAMGMLSAASAIDMSGTTSLIDEHLALYYTYVAKSDQVPEKEQRVRQNAMQTEAAHRRSMKVSETGPLPTGASVRADMVGFRLIEATPTEVLAYVETRLSLKSGELGAEQVTFTVAALSVSWVNGDWKFSTSAAAHLKDLIGSSPLPAIAAPGDTAFNTAGWTAIRQAS